MNKKDKKHIKVLKQYLVSANDRAKYSIERFDILIITLSSGGIVLSMSFFENYKNIDKTMVYNGCLCFAFALIINLVSQITGYYANRYDIKYVREEIRELEKKSFFETYAKYDCFKKVFNFMTRLFNTSSLVSFVIGMIFIVLFIKNLNF
jgi:hypothetical protein